MNQTLRLGIQRRRRFVENQDPGVLENGPRNRYPLLLAAGQLVAALADHCIITVRQGRDMLVDGSSTGRCDQLSVGGIGIAIAQIGFDRVVNEIGFLGHDTDRLAK